MDKKLLFYQDRPQGVQCQLCPHYCLLHEEKVGKCHVRTVKDDSPVAINYGEVASAAIDPIEKKPLYHYKPGKNILSIGSFGCNMSCQFCQNYTISQHKPQSQYVSPKNLIKSISTVENNIGVAFTYNEPLMWYEYIIEAAKEIKAWNEEISVVVVTNGYINQQPLEKLLPYVDAMNIDLKGYSNGFYRKICGATLEPVLETIKRSSEECHVEITTLLVTEENDSIEEVGQIARFIASINRGIPLHLSRYFPQYQMNHEPTDLEVMLRAWEEAKNMLDYVYPGNVQGVDNDTYCPHCKQRLIARSRYEIEVLLSDEDCPKCGQHIGIVL